MEDLSTEDVSDIQEKEYNPIDPINNICERFHLVARQLRSRHEDRDTLDIQDEYDIQELVIAYCTCILTTFVQKNGHQVMLANPLGWIFFLNKNKL